MPTIFLWACRYICMLAHVLVHIKMTLRVSECVNYFGVSVISKLGNVKNKLRPLHVVLSRCCGALVNRNTYSGTTPKFIAEK